VPTQAALQKHLQYKKSIRFSAIVTEPPKAAAGSYLQDMHKHQM